MGTPALSSSPDETSALARDYWELRRRYDAAMEALRGIYHGAELETDQGETVETLFTQHNQLL